MLAATSGGTNSSHWASPARSPKYHMSCGSLISIRRMAPRHAASLRSTSGSSTANSASPPPSPTPAVSSTRQLAPPTKRCSLDTRTEHRTRTVRHGSPRPRTHGAASISKRVVLAWISLVYGVSLRRPTAIAGRSDRVASRRQVKISRELYVLDNGAAAVDADDLAGDVGGGRHAEEDDGSGDLLGLADAAHGDAVHGAGVRQPAHRLPVQRDAAAVADVGADASRRDGVDAYAVARPLGGEAPGELVHAAFGRRVHRQVRRGVERGGGGDVHHAAAAASRRRGWASWARWKQDSRLVAMRRAYSSGAVSAAGPTITWPALLTSMSSLPPNASRAAATSASLSPRMDRRRRTP